MSRMQSHMLPGGRLHLNDGPIDLVIEADGTQRNIAFDAAQLRFATVLDELCTELILLRQPTGRMPHGSVAQRMWRATLGHDGFITPMAAVAGSVAEEILAAMTAAASLARAFVNNGGDIAIHLDHGAAYTIGLVDRPNRPSLFATTAIASSDPVRGIATSGWRGRSFSLGIADAVTVLAESASMADSAATIIANAVDLPGHPGITRVPASGLQPDSDLQDRLVTRGVAALAEDEIGSALDRGVAKANDLITRGCVTGCALHLAGHTRTAGAMAGSSPRRLAVNA